MPTGVPRSQGPCTIDGCSAKAASRGMCGRHYARWNRHCDPLYVVPKEVSSEKMSKARKAKKHPPDCTHCAPDVGRKISAAKRGRFTGPDNPFYGRHHSAKTKAALSAVNSAKTGVEAGHWMGDDITYHGLHKRLRKTLPLVCSVCGTDEHIEIALRRDTPRDVLRFDKAQGLYWSTEPGHYTTLCVLHHRRYDRGLITLP